MNLEGFMKSFTSICTVILALALLVAPAFAQEPTDTDKRINELEKKIEQLMKDKEKEEYVIPSRG